MVLKRSGSSVHTSLSNFKTDRTKNRPSFFWSRIRPANGARIRPISTVPCERKADLDEFEHGLEFIRSRVNGVSADGHLSGNFPRAPDIVSGYYSPLI